MKYVALLLCAVLTGCASVSTQSYRPYKNREKKAYARADRSIPFDEVKTNFQAYAETEVAWAGIIDDIQFKENERTIQVAFDVDHRTFDWMDHGGGSRYRLSAESAGRIKVGWTVDKPARISYLKTLAKPGYMIIVYGKPWRQGDGAIQLAATAVRPIKSGAVEFLPGVGKEAGEEVPAAD